MFESRKSIHVDNKQACPHVSHLALTNNCGEFLFANIAALVNKCILHSVESSRQEAPQTMCSPNPTIVLQIIPADINDAQLTPTDNFNFECYRLSMYIPLCCTLW